MAFSEVVFISIFEKWPFFRCFLVKMTFFYVKMPFLTVLAQRLRKWVVRLGVWVYKSLENSVKTVISCKYRAKRHCISTGLHLFNKNRVFDRFLTQLIQPKPRDPFHDVHFSVFIKGSQYFKPEYSMTRQNCVFS